MALSNSINFKLNRDQVITLALRRINAIGQGESPTTTAATEAAVALNALVKAWEADGMPLWKITTQTFTPTASTSSYTIGIGATINKKPPLKVHQAWYRNTASSKDTPLMLITRDEYNLISTKSSTGTPNQMYYNPPGDLGGGEMSGTFYLYNTPDSTFASGNTIYFVGQLPFDDYDATSDDTDFPSYWINALSWGLAEQLSYEYGVPPNLAKNIMLMATKEKQQALSFGSEEGSLFLAPSYQYLAELKRG